jgi:hypothetical protein
LGNGTSANDHNQVVTLAWRPLHQEGTGL